MHSCIVDKLGKDVLVTDLVKASRAFRTVHFFTPNLPSLNVLITSYMSKQPSGLRTTNYMSTQPRSLLSQLPQARKSRQPGSRLRKRLATRNYRLVRQASSLLTSALNFLLQPSLCLMQIIRPSPHLVSTAMNFAKPKKSKDSRRQSSTSSEEDEAFTVPISLAEEEVNVVHDMVVSSLTKPKRPTAGNRQSQPQSSSQVRFPIVCFDVVNGSTLVRKPFSWTKKRKISDVFFV